MCLGIPGKVIETYREHDVQMGRVDFGGVSKRVCLEHLPEARPGNYVIVHVGFGLSIVDEEEARQVFAFLAAMDELDELGERKAEVGSRRAEVGGQRSDVRETSPLMNDNRPLTAAPPDP